MRKISIRLRIMALILFLVCVAFGVGVFFYINLLELRDFSTNEVEKVMLDGQKEKLKTAVHSLAIVLADGLKEISGQQAQMEYLRKMTNNVYFETDRSGYYFVYKGTVCMSLPTMPERQGNDLRAVADKNGVRYVHELATQAQKGGGFVRYIFPKNGKGDQPKLAYSEMIPGTDMWIGTGIYIDNIDEKKASIDSDIRRMMSHILAILIPVLVVLFAGIVLPVSVVVFKSIIRPLNSATSVAKRVAAGDLSVNVAVQGSDEITHLESALDTMIHSLSKKIDEINAATRALQEKNDAAEQSAAEAQRSKESVVAKTNEILRAVQKLEGVVEIVSSASEELSAQIEQSSRGAEEQAHQLGETATSMEEMNSTVLEVAKNASNAATTADKARTKAVDGATIVEKAVDSIKEVHRNSQAMQADMHGLGEQAKGIGQIISVISDIADQTNLLALNAAIEAARAGEAGRGFAVVADEVRKLAEKTMAATNEVNKAIHGIQDGTKKNIENVEKSWEVIEEATELSSKSGESLHEIVSLVEAATDQVRSIATASEEQSSASEEINRNIDDVNRVASETADAMKQSSQAVSELASQAQILKSLIEDMKADTAGATTPALAAAPRVLLS